MAQKGAQALERELRFCNIWKKVGEVRRLAIFSQSGFAALHDLSLAEGFTGTDFVYQDSQLGWWHIGLGVFTSVQRTSITAMSSPSPGRLWPPDVTFRRNGQCRDP